MTVAQLLESLVGNVCAIKGTHYDGTMFKSVDIETYAEELEQYGFNRYGYERLVNGMTGEFIDTLVFFGPTFYQRLQKFVADAEYSVRNAMTDAVTRQPLDSEESKSYVKVWLVYIIVGNTSKFRERPKAYQSEMYTRERYMATGKTRR